MGRNAEMPQNKAFLLRKQKGKCSWRGLSFRNEDVLEIDHKIAKALGGTNDNSNKQIIHGHCHDEKTALDLIQIMEKRATKFFIELAREWSKTNYVWIDDIPVVLRS